MADEIIEKLHEYSDGDIESFLKVYYTVRELARDPVIKFAIMKDTQSKYFDKEYICPVCGIVMKNSNKTQHNRSKFHTKILELSQQKNVQ